MLIDTICTTDWYRGISGVLYIDPVISRLRYGEYMGYFRSPRHIPLTSVWMDDPCPKRPARWVTHWNRNPLSYASRLFKHGVSVSDISRLLGHADETTTLRHYIFGLDDSDTLITKVYEALGCRKNGINTKEAGKVTKSDQKIISFPTSRNPANPHKTLKKRV